MAGQKNSAQGKEGAGAPAAAQMSFEQAIEKLESCAARLDDSNLSLDEAIAAYAEGAACHARCVAILDGAQQRIEEIGSGSVEDSPNV
jgi:exodeoxyribonuclease VII small subunit